MERNVKILLAWFEARDAVSALLGFRLPDERDDICSLIARYEAQRAAVEARPPFEAGANTVDPLPERIAERGAELVALFGGNSAKPGRYGLQAGIVDLTSLISVQKAVALDEIQGRVAAASADNWETLADLCLAGPQIDSGDVKGAFDKDGKGVTLSSANPNMRVGAVQTVNSSDQAGYQVMGFAISFGTRHLHVVEHRGRLFLKDGYHRAYGLLSHGITRVPCLFERAETFQAVHSGGTTLIAPEHLLGDHPPRVADLLDPDVSATATQQYYRKVIRIRAEEFVINV